MEQTQNGGGMTSMLMELLGSKIEARAKRSELKARMLAAGYSEDDVKTFNTLEHGFIDAVKGMQAAVAIAENTDHLPSAEYSKAAATYLKGAVTYMYGVWEATHTNPQDFNYQRDNSEFIGKLDGAITNAQKIIDKHAFAARQAERA